MALSYVGGTSGGGTGASYTVSLNGTLTGGSNSSPSAGDLILVFTGEANGASVTSTCSGNTAGAYSTIRAHQNQADTHDANLDSFYKFAGATPDTTLTITRGNNNTTYGSATVVHVWRGADTTNPFDVTPTVAASSNGSAANPAAITPTTAGSVVLYCGHASQLAASGTAYTTAGTYPISLKFDGSTGDSIVMASHYTAWTSGAYDPAAFAGSTTATTLGWVALTVVIKPFIAVTHATTSVIVGPYSAVSGTSQRNASHATTGTLAAGKASASGAAARTAAVVTHATTSTAIGSESSVTGSAARFRAHATTGELFGDGSAVAGIAARWRAFAASGDLAGPGAAVSGASARFRAHDTTGTPTSPGAELAGLAARTRQHDAAGILSAPESAIAASARHNIPHGTSGTLAAGDSAVSGDASRNTTAATHITTGELAGDGAAVAGAANRIRAFSASGVLAGADSALAGIAARTREHAAGGALSGDQPSLLFGSAQRNVSHATDGALVADAGSADGTSARVGVPVSHDTAGDLSGAGPEISGASSSGGPVWPSPEDVKAGVVYGPGGFDYVGELVCDSEGEGGSTTVIMSGAEPETIIKTVVRTVYVDRPVPAEPGNTTPAIEYVTIDGLPIPTQVAGVVSARDATIETQAGDIEALRAENEALAVLLMATIQ